MNRTSVIRCQLRASAAARPRWLLPALVVTLVTACGGPNEPATQAGAPQTFADAPSCLAGAVVEVELESWKQALEGITHWPMSDGEPEANLDEAPNYGTVLGELGFGPLPDRTIEELTPERGVMALTSVQIVDLRRGGDAAPDKLVAARFRNAAGAESLRALVLRPVPGQDGVYCSLGNDLSHEKESGEEPCIEAHPGPARSLKIVTLLAPDRDAIVMRDAGGWCGGGSRRGDRFSTSFWGVEGGRLIRYFEVVTAEAWYQSPDPPVVVLRGEIELSDTWPKTISLTEVMECLSPDESTGSGDDCQPYERTRTYQYVDDRYVQPNEPTGAMDAVGNEPREPPQ